MDGVEAEQENFRQCEAAVAHPIDGRVGTASTGNCVCVCMCVRVCCVCVCPVLDELHAAKEKLKQVSASEEGKLEPGLNGCQCVSRADMAVPLQYEESHQRALFEKCMGLEFRVTEGVSWPCPQAHYCSVVSRRQGNVSGLPVPGPPCP